MGKEILERYVKKVESDIAKLQEKISSLQKERDVVLDTIKKLEERTHESSNLLGSHENVMCPLPNVPTLIHTE